ncbi:MAG: M48 family metallopeptidase [Candidatus Omnitrophica bacterium]|nr:M48 family metallopeptidase [Candidatus Omnitrophota bacterium]
MWELIQENKKKSWLIFIYMGICLLLIGYLIGYVWFSSQGAVYGIFLAICLWIILSLISYASGDSILLFSSHAKSVSHNIHPQLFNVVEEIKIAANLPVMPKIYIIDTPATNAFATGKTIENSSIAITAGLLSQLNRDELQGVIAHEMSHIINRDVMYMTFAGVMLGSITLLSQIFLRGMWYSGSSRRYRSRSSSSGGGNAQIIAMIIALIFAILAPILARLFYFSLSRKREYLADACAVRLTRYPLGLASALKKISNSKIPLESANKITAPMYIDNPFKKEKMKVSSLFSTHPPIEERIQILGSLMQGVNYTEYQKAFSKIKGQSSLIPSSGLSDSKNISIKQTSATKNPSQTIKKNVRDTGDLIRALNNFIFLTCVCGLKLKIPPNFKKQSTSCPRCSRNIPVPLADVKIAAAALGAKGKSLKKNVSQQIKQVYLRKNKNWETFNCNSCHSLVQLSPLLTEATIPCPNCHQKINIENT